MKHRMPGFFLLIYTQMKGFRALATTVMVVVTDVLSNIFQQPYLIYDTSVALRLTAPHLLLVT